MPPGRQVEGKHAVLAVFQIGAIIAVR